MLFQTTIFKIMLFKIAFKKKAKKISKLKKWLEKIKILKISKKILNLKNTRKIRIKSQIRCSWCPACKE